MTYESENIDELKEWYKYTIDPNNTAFLIYAIFHGLFTVRMMDYRFEERIKEIKHIILSKSDKIPKYTLDSYERILKDIIVGCQEVKKKVDSFYYGSKEIIEEITYDYKMNRDKPGAENIYKKIGKEMIDKEVNFLIKYEKILISYNDKIISLKKNLSD